MKTKTEKYEIIIDDTIEIDGHTLYRIKALIDFNDVKAGDLGGYIESVNNLSDELDCWAYDDSKIYEKARVSRNATIHNNCTLHGNAKMFGHASAFNNVEIGNQMIINDFASIYGNVKLLGHGLICSRAKINGHVLIKAKDVHIGKDTIISDKNIVSDKLIIRGRYEIDPRNKKNISTVWTVTDYTDQGIYVKFIPNKYTDYTDIYKEGKSVDFIGDNGNIYNIDHLNFNFLFDEDEFEKIKKGEKEIVVNDVPAIDLSTNTYNFITVKFLVED